MSVNLTPKKMGNFLKVKHGFPFLGEFFATSGKYIVLTPGNFYESGGFKQTSGKEKYYISDFPEEYLCSEGDLIVAMTEQAEGLLGSTAIVPEKGVYLHNQRIGLISWDGDIVDKRYLYYLFMTRSVRKQIRDTASGTKVKHTSPERIYDVDVFIPDIIVQQHNAALLWMIDKKIQLNTRIIDELEAMAKTVYDYWFVQFDFPDENGRPYRSSGGKMKWDEQLKRETPTGWKVKHLVEIEPDIITGKTPLTACAENYNGNIPFITIGDIRNNVFVVSTEITLSKIGADSQQNKYIPEDSICVTCIASPGLVGFSSERSQTNQQINTVVCKNAYNRYFLFFALKQYFEFAAGAKNGSTFANMNKDDFSTIEILQPEIKIIQQYHETTYPMFRKIKEATMETKILRNLRDWLLPMLMNGQITVEEG